MTLAPLYHDGELVREETKIVETNRNLTLVGGVIIGTGCFLLIVVIVIVLERRDVVLKNMIDKERRRRMNRPDLYDLIIERMRREHDLRIVEEQEIVVPKTRRSSIFTLLARRFSMKSSASSTADGPIGHALRKIPMDLFSLDANCHAAMSGRSVTPTPSPAMKNERAVLSRASSLPAKRCYSEEAPYDMKTPSMGDNDVFTNDSLGVSAPASMGVASPLSSPALSPYASPRPSPLPSPLLSPRFSKRHTYHRQRSPVPLGMSSKTEADISMATMNNQQIATAAHNAWLLQQTSQDSIPEQEHEQDEDDARSGHPVVATVVLPGRQRIHSSPHKTQVVVTEPIEEHASENDTSGGGGGAGGGADGGAYGCGGGSSKHQQSVSSSIEGDRQMKDNAHLPNNRNTTNTVHGQNNQNIDTLSKPESTGERRVSHEPETDVRTPPEVVIDDGQV